MRTKHHRFPKCFRDRKHEFYEEKPRGNILWVSEMEHRAWNVLTRNSQFNLGEIMESLNRFLPKDVRLIAVKQDRG